MTTSSQKSIYTGIALALLAVVLWSGNFIIARGAAQEIRPISMAFFRWVIASVVIMPFAIRTFQKEWPVVRRAWPYLLWVALTGIALFNTFVYVGAHFTTAINLALIGTTSSPIFAIILAKIFLKEQIGWAKLTGMILCIAGVVFLLAKGNLNNLLHFQFTEGDAWILLGAFCFAVYNTLVRKKPVGISPVNFLFIIFCLGTLLLLPFFLWEMQHQPRIRWNPGLFGMLLYLGIPASVISYWCWNLAIGRLGAGRTALFGNLIPIFASLEAAILLSETFTMTHIISMILVFAGILIANWKIIAGRS
jgi:drug/metabolite transporter (DMT)-like permease